MDWDEPRSLSQVRMIRQYIRIRSMDDTRLTKKVYLWDRWLNLCTNIKTWNYEVQDILRRNKINIYYDSETDPPTYIISQLQASLKEKDRHSLQWQCLSVSKMRDYNKFVSFQEDRHYLNMPLPYILKSHQPLLVSGSSLSGWRLGAGRGRGSPGI